MVHTQIKTDVKPCFTQIGDNIRKGDHNDEKTQKHR